MNEGSYPKQYVKIKERYRNIMDNLEKMGEELRRSGPIDKKTSHLIQLAASAAIHSEGATHSHARRALEAGATPDELRHAIILLISTIGFPRVSAALSWVEDIIGEK